MQVRSELVQISNIKCIYEFLRVLKLIVICVVSDIISEIIVSFDLVLKAVIDLTTAEINYLIYYLFILIIHYYQSEKSDNLSEKRVCDNSLKMHDMKHWVYLYKAKSLS